MACDVKKRRFSCIEDKELRRRFLFSDESESSPADIGIPHWVFTEPSNRASLLTFTGDFHIICKALVGVNRNPTPTSYFFHVFSFDKAMCDRTISSFYRYFWRSCLTRGRTVASEIQLSISRDFSHEFNS